MQPAEATAVSAGQLQRGILQVTTYRAYQLDARRRILTASWVEAANDGEARAKAAEDLCEDDIPAVELWQATRLVDEITCDEDGKD
jgi:hypothetical protein